MGIRELLTKPGRRASLEGDGRHELESLIGTFVEQLHSGRVVVDGAELGVPEHVHWKLHAETDHRRSKLMLRLEAESVPHARRLEQELARPGD